MIDLSSILWTAIFFIAVMILAEIVLRRKEKRDLWEGKKEWMP